MVIATVRQGGSITIPVEIRQQADLKDGDAVEVEVVDGCIVLRPSDIDPEQAWFWTPEWQAKEREADEAIAAGRVTFHASDEEFLTALEQAARDADARGR